MDVIEQLEVILPNLADTAARVRADQFDDATPCTSFRVRDLFDHMIGGAAQFAPQLRGEPPAAPPAGLTDADRPAALRRAIDDLLDSVRHPGALGRTVELPFGQVPGSVLARFLTVDGMVHTWDLAQATGQEYSPPDALAAEVLAAARDLIAPAMRDGDTFAAEVPVAAGSPVLARLIAFTGRAA